MAKKEKSVAVCVTLPESIRDKLQEISDKDNDGNLSLTVRSIIKKSIGKDGEL